MKMNENSINVIKATKFLVVLLIIVLGSYGLFYYAQYKSEKKIMSLNVSKLSAEQNNSNSKPAANFDSNLTKILDQEKADEQYLAALPVKTMVPGATRVPVLLYHHIEEISDDRPAEEKSYYVAPAMFERQMAWLAENNWQVISLSRLTNYLKTGKNKPPTRSIILTFDDGTIGQYEHAYPILNSYGFSATFFVVTNWIEEASRKQKSGYMDWTELEEMKNNGMEIGSHTVSHKTLGGSSDEEILSELSQSKNILEEKLGTTIFSLAYPGGSYNQTVQAKAKESGYICASSVEKNIDHKEDELYYLGRMHIDNDMPYFKARIEGRFFK